MSHSRFSLRGNCWIEFTGQRFKTRFKPVKAKVKKRSLWEKWQASRRTKRECKNASFR